MPTIGRNYSGEQKVNFECSVPFSKCLRAKIYSNINVYFYPQACQTLLFKESIPLFFSLGSWTRTTLPQIGSHSATLIENHIYSTAKETRKFIPLKLMTNKICICFTVYCTVGFTCNIHFLNSTYLIFNQFKNKFSRFFCC